MTFDATKYLQTQHLFPEGAELFQQGTLASQVHLVMSGLVKLTDLDKSGRESVVGIRQTNSFLGTTAALLGEPHAVGATTVTPCEIGSIESRKFRHLVRNDPELSWHLNICHSREIGGLVEHLRLWRILRARRRLEQFLRHLIVHRQPPKAKVKLKVDLKMWEVASLIGITAPHLSRLFAELERDGILIRRKGWLIVKDSSRLAE